MSITGNLRTLEFAELLQWLAQGQKTGALVIDNGQTEKRIFFKSGKIISSQSNNPAEHLGAYMVREGLLDEETLARAVKLQESTQILLGKVLVTLGTISEEELHRILKRKTEESLYELFAWTEGDFRFLPDDLPKLPMVPIEVDVTNVVLEGARRFDEARRDAEVGTGDYGQEIEDVLNSQIFQGIDIADSITEVTPPSPALDEHSSEQKLKPLAMPEIEPEETTADASQAKPSNSGSAKSGGTKPMLAAVAAVVAVAIGVGAYFFMRPEPAAGTADRATLETPAVAETLTVEDDLYQPLDSEPATDNSEAAVDPISPPAQQDQSEEMRAQYEAELEILKRQLTEAQGAAAERDEAMDKIAALEEQVAEAQEAAESFETNDTPRAEFEVAQLSEPGSDTIFFAGGDVAPPLGSPLPSTEADQEAGTEFAAEMVESAPAPPIPETVEVAMPEAADTEPVEDAVDDAVDDEPEPLIKSPTLLSRPKPRYPAAAVRLGREAVINLRLLIDENGKVVEVERTGSDPGLGFSKSAINAALATKWAPATSDGTPIEMWAEMRIAFKP